MKSTVHHSRSDLVSYGLASWYGPLDPMEKSHRHNEIELNFVSRGAITYFFAGSEVTIEAHRLALFWAAIPHQVIGWEAPVTFSWITIPLGYFLQWPLPDSLRQGVLNGQLVFDQQSAAAQVDDWLFRQWYADLHSGSPERSRIVLLEVEARLRRLGLALEAAEPHNSYVPRAEEGRLIKAAEMARYIHDHYREPLNVGQIAHTVGLHPNYAMRIFKRTFGVSMVEYITQHRVSHAQRLLVTTEDNILHLALESGFGSVSQFYTAFERLCGQSPGQYRASLQKFQPAVNTSTL